MGGEERAVTPVGATEGALHREAWRIFFIFFIIALSKSGGLQSPGMA